MGHLCPMKRVTLKDGATVVLRPIRPEDASELTALYDRLSPETAYQRFFTVMARFCPLTAARAPRHRRPHRGTTSVPMVRASMLPET